MDDAGKRYPAGTNLGGVISHFYVIRPAPGVSVKGWLAPSLEIMMVLSFGKPGTIALAGDFPSRRPAAPLEILGPLRQALHYDLPAGSDVIVLPFVLDGFSRLFSLDLSASGSMPELPEPLWDRLRRLHADVGRITTTEDRLAMLRDFLSTGPATPAPAAIPLLQGVPELHHPARSPVRSIAVSAGRSERLIQLRFRKFTGYSSKELIRFLRFKNVLYDIRASENADWLNLVEKHGYHDQSHLYKDFRYYTGTSPRRFLKLTSESGFCFYH